MLLYFRHGKHAIRRTNLTQAVFAGKMIYRKNRRDFLKNVRENKMRNHSGEI